MTTKSIAWTTGDGNISLTYQGQGDGDITINSDPNNLDTARSQVINIETTAGSPAVVKNFTVSQGACPFPVGDVRNFAYTGNVQSVILPAGQYKLQCWGAQGGTCSSGYSGGKGGYSEGVLTLTSPTTVYIFVGGQGGQSGNGGWNGGGGGSGSSSYSSGSEYGSSTFGCGGGATDIALVTSSMSYSSYRNNRSPESLLSRMIVAGGGSGGAYGYQEVATTTTTWETIDSGNIADLSHHGEGSSTLVLGHLEAGETYRLSVSGYSLTRYAYEYIDPYTWGGWLSNNGTFSPSSSVSYDHITLTLQGATSFSGTYSFQKRTTSSSTSTDSDSKAGYVGGGTNGGGYSSSYYGKQNGAGSNGSFGLGANQTVTNYRYGAGCGGGGWYGGGNSYSDSGLSTIRCSGGGSGFVNTAANAQYRPSDYTGLQLDSGATYAGSQSFPAVDSGNETGHSGNGYARITRIAVLNITLRLKDSESQQPIVNTSVTLTSGSDTHTSTTDASGEATFSVQNGTYSVSCVGYTLTPSQITVTKNQTFDFVAELPSIREYSYTGSVQQDSLPAGTYKIECWGAQGGYRSSSSYGGKGGYSTGTLNLTENTTIYVYVGGSGNTGGTSGGFNGGGRRYSYVGGGGASDVRISQDSLYARVIVAGGGGSDGATSKGGGAGGGTNGQNTTASSYGTGGYGGGASVSSPNTGGTSYFAGINATQPTSTSPTSQAETYNGFGWGGSGSYRSSGYGGAGGGGWFGGVGTYPDGSGDDDKGGGGGSGYVYSSSTASNYPSGCLLNSDYYLDNASTIAGNASMPSTSGSTETGHSGNGYVRITRV